MAGRLVSSVAALLVTTGLLFAVFKKEEPAAGVRLPPPRATLLAAASTPLHGLAGAALIPHGDITYDPRPPGEDEAVALHEAAIAAGAMLGSLGVDLCVLITPHGVQSERDLGVYTAASATGFVELDNRTDFITEVPLDFDLSRRLATTLAADEGNDNNVTELRVWCDTEPFPLRWGEVCPLLLARQGGFRPRRVVILSIPARRSKVSSMVPEIRSLGRALRRALANETFAVIVSGDLAHAHLADGPYGYSPTADPFEAAVATWLRNISDTRALLNDAASLVDTALSCGFLGLVLLLGILEEDNLAGANGAGGAQRHHHHLHHHQEATTTTPKTTTQDFAFVNDPPGNVVGPFHPTYYGMAVASWKKKALTTT